MSAKSERLFGWRMLLQDADALGSLPHAEPCRSVPCVHLTACLACVCRERGKLWDPSSKQRWGHDAFESLERGEEPPQDDYLQEVRQAAGAGAWWLVASWPCVLWPQTAVQAGLMDDSC